MGRAGLGRAAETSWAVFVLVVFLFSWFSRQTTWEIVGPEPDPPPYETRGVTVEAGVPEPGCLKESCSSVMQKLLPHFTEEETEAQRGRRTCPRAHSWGRSWEGVSQQGAEVGGAARAGHFPPILPRLTAALLPTLCSGPPQAASFLSKWPVLSLSSPLCSEVDANPSWLHRSAWKLSRLGHSGSI